MHKQPKRQKSLKCEKQEQNFNSKIRFWYSKKAELLKDGSLSTCYCAKHFRQTARSVYYRFQYKISYKNSPNRQFILRSYTICFVQLGCAAGIHPWSQISWLWIPWSPNSHGPESQGPEFSQARMSTALYRVWIFPLPRIAKNLSRFWFLAPFEIWSISISVYRKVKVQN